MEEIGIESSLVEAIRSGEKTLEVRLGTPEVLRIVEGSILPIREDFWYEDTILESLSHALQVQVTEVLYFESFREAFDAVDYQLAAPTARSKTEALNYYHHMYSREEEREYGAVVLSIEPVG